MSTDIHESEQFTITRYCGPDYEGKGPGKHRLRWQLTGRQLTGLNGWFSLDREGIDELKRVLNEVEIDPD